MKQIKQVIHEECKNCENLRTISVYMDGSGYYACGRTPNHVEENRHKFPCNRFINCNDYFVIVEKEVPYPKFVGEHYAYSVSCAKHFNTKEEALNNIPNDGLDWEVLHVDWLKRQNKKDIDIDPWDGEKPHAKGGFVEKYCL